MRWEMSTIYLVIIGLEVLVSNYQHRKLYTWRETFITIYLSVLNGLLDLAVRGIYLLLLTFIFQFHFIHIGSVHNLQPTFLSGTY